MLEQILMGAIILIAFIQSIRVINLKDRLAKAEKAIKDSKT